MSILKSCCCFSNVRSGSIACGVYCLVLSIISAGIVAYNLYIYEVYNVPTSQNFDISQLTHNLNISQDALNGTAIYDVPSMDRNSHRIFQSIFLCALVVACCLFLASLLLITGVSLNRKNLLVPWLVVMALNVILDTGTMIYHSTLVIHLTYIIIEMVIWLLLTVLNIYCLLCVFSQHQELKSGRGTRDHTRRDSVRLTYHPGVQHVHINQGPIIINGTLPQAITSTVQSAGYVASPPNGKVTATLLVSAPDYSAASGQPPQYQEVTSNGPLSFPKDTLLSHLPQRSSKGSDSPPPPYSS